VVMATMEVLGAFESVFAKALKTAGTGA
jgi:hypothetical protein